MTDENKQEDFVARGRIIDKEMFAHELLTGTDFLTRLFYIGLVVCADDEGRIKGSPKYLKGKIFPYDDIPETKIAEMVNALAGIGCLMVYQVTTSDYIQHPNWSKWQPIRKDRARPSDCPAPPENATTSMKVIAGQPSDNQMSTGCRHNLTQPNLTQPNLTQPKDSIGPKNKTKKFLKPSPKEIADYASSIQYNLDGQKFFDYYESKGWMVGKSPMKNWKACVRTWKGNNYGGTNGKSRQGYFDNAGSGKYPD